MWDHFQKVIVQNELWDLQQAIHFQFNDCKQQVSLEQQVQEDEGGLIIL